MDAYQLAGGDYKDLERKKPNQPPNENINVQDVVFELHGEEEIDMDDLK